MEFEDRLNALSQKVRNQHDSILTEEATKNALVMPFISSVLGYDVFDPIEVVPEFTADVGVKRGEKVDYAIMRDAEVQILIECKKVTGELRIEHASQLFRYFSVTNARIAVLTNGVVYSFYTDLDAPNKMDNRPFLVLDMRDIDETLVPELRKLTKDVFDLDSVISAAEELKYVGALKRALGRQLREPQEDFVRLLVSEVYDGRLTQEKKRQFTELVGKASKQYLTEQVNDRLKTALGSTQTFASHGGREAAEAAVSSVEVADNDLSRDTTVQTTSEELEAYQVVKAIAVSEVSPERIVHRDGQTYFAILLDDNNRRTIARLWFNGKKQKYLGLFDAEKKETRMPIESVDQIYQYADHIRASVRRFVSE